VQGGEYARRVRAVDQLAARHRNPEPRPEQRLGGGGAEAADRFGPDRRDLALEPGMAGFDLALRGRFVQATLAARLPFEMLHGVGHVERAAVDAGGLQRAVEQAPGRADEGQAAAVLLVAGLLAHQHHAGVRIAGAEDRLRRVRVERTVAAVFRFLAQHLQRRSHALRIGFSREGSMKKGLLVVLALAASPAVAQQDFSKVEIEATQLSDSAWLLVGAGGNIGLSVGSDGVVMIDDQFAPLTPKIQAALAKISPKPVKFLINTHWHFDHTGGNENFGGTGAVIDDAQWGKGFLDPERFVTMLYEGMRKK
jgi:hypothetical protein